VLGLGGLGVEVEGCGAEGEESGFVMEEGGDEEEGEVGCAGLAVVLVVLVVLVRETGRRVEL
jgi:hypothetical protein